MAYMNEDDFHFMPKDGQVYLFIVKQKWFEKISSPHVRWIKDVYSHSVSV